MIRVLLIAYGFILFSCQSTPSNSEEPISTEQKEQPTQETKPDPEVALTFINSYVENSMDYTNGLNVEEWANTQTNVTDNFKAELDKIMREGEAADPELGLGFDPIFNAQEFPDEGFVLDTVDGEYVIVKAKAAGWEGFKVTMKLKNKDGKWLVDGAGIINIPEDRVGGE